MRQTSELRAAMKVAQSGLEPAAKHSRAEEQLKAKKERHADWLRLKPVAKQGRAGERRLSTP